MRFEALMLYKRLFIAAFYDDDEDTIILEQNEDNNWPFDDDEFSFEDIADDEEEELAHPPLTVRPKRQLIEGLTMEYAEFTDRTFSGFQLGHFSFYNVTFRNCTFDIIDCQSGRFVACKFEDCNIISFSGEGYGFRECEFTRCRWSGVPCLDDCFYYSNCKYTDCTEDYD